MNTLYATDGKEWRDWLKRHHRKEEEIWLVYYKKHTGRPSVTYKESLEEALCFGWIDGLRRRIDGEKYAHRFTPRKAKSRWSPFNIRLANELIKRKRMTKAGMLAFEQRVSYDEEILKVRSAKVLVIPPDIQEALRSNEAAWKNFQALAPSFKKQYVWWIASAKKKETKERRLNEAIELLEKNQKLGMK